MLALGKSVENTPGSTYGNETYFYRAWIGRSYFFSDTKSQGKPMRLSLIVCTRNRAGPLRQALSAFAALEGGDDRELVLVDNGSTDASSDVLAEFANSYIRPIKVVSEPLAGLSRARNRGLSVASGELIAFTDDDCYPAPDFTSAIVRRFSDPNVSFMGGRVLLFDDTDLPITIQELNKNVSFAPSSFIQSGLIHGANMAFRRPVLMEIGGFDERLGAGAVFRSGEDTDAIIRCNTAGYSGVYDPAVIVHHHHGRKVESEGVALREGYAVGRAACMVKQCVDPRSRELYAKQWYWRLRKQSWRVRRQELWPALKFVAHCGFSPKKIMQHPRGSLATD